MSTYQEIIDIADGNYRNNITPARKAKWLDFMIKQLFQLQVTQEVTQDMVEIQKNIQFYEIPPDCEKDDIKYMTIETSKDSGRYNKITYHNVEENAPSGSYTIIEGMIMIDPKPSENKTGWIFYIKSPLTVTEAILGNQAELDPAYHEILVHGLNERYAAARRDGVAKNNFKADWDSLLGDFLMAQLNKAPGYPSAVDAMPRRSRYGRQMGNSFESVSNE